MGIAILIENTNPKWQYQLVHTQNGNVSFHLCENIIFPSNHLNRRTRILIGNTNPYQEFQDAKWQRGISPLREHDFSVNHL